MQPTSEEKLILPEGIDIDAFVKEIKRKFPIEREPPLRKSFEYWDSFDWRIYADDGAMVSYPEDGHLRLTWQSRQPPHSRFEAVVAKVPHFSSELPSGDFRKALDAVLEMRAMLPIACCFSELQPFRINDKRGKKIASLIWELTKAGKPGDKSTVNLEPILRIIEIRGYRGKFSELVTYLNSRIDMRREHHSHLDRALAAIGSTPQSYSSKLRLEIAPEIRSDQAAKIIHRRLLEIIRCNEDGVQKAIDTEFLHDFRVAVRRTRAALTQIKFVFPQPIVDRFRKEFSWLGQLTGPARDIDVYNLTIDEYKAMLPAAQHEHLEPLRRFLKLHQEIEQKVVAKGLQSQRYKTLVNAWGQFLGKQLPKRTTLANAKRPAVELASMQIRRTFEKVVKKGLAITPQSPTTLLHRLRLICKKLRYLLEFFRSLYDGEKIDILVKQLKILQDNLGDFHDLEIQQKTLVKFGQQMIDEGQVNAEPLMAMGRLVAKLEERQAEEGRKFFSRFKKFRCAKNVALFEDLFGPPSRRQD